MAAAQSPPTLAEAKQSARLGLAAIPCFSLVPFLDPASAEVSALVKKHNLVPQRTVTTANVALMQESLPVGSLASSLRFPGVAALLPLQVFPPERQPAVQAARSRLFALFRSGTSGDPPDDGAPPAIEHRAAAPVSLSYDLVKDLGLYVVDGNHRLRAMNAHAKAAGDDQNLDMDAEQQAQYSLYMDMYLPNLFDHVPLYVSLTLEQNSANSFASIAQLRSISGTLAVVKAARYSADTFKRTTGTSTPLANPLQSLVTARYRVELLSKCVELHPVASVMLESLSSARFKTILGYGSGGWGSGIAFYILALRDLSSFAAIVDPRALTLASPDLLSNLSNRTGKPLQNPLYIESAAGAAQETAGGVLVDKDARARMALVAKSLPLRAPHNRHIPPAVRVTLEKLAAQLKEAPRGLAQDDGDGGERWNVDEAFLAGLPAMIYDELIDTSLLSSLDTLGTKASAATKNKRKPVEPKSTFLVSLNELVSEWWLPFGRFLSYFVACVHALDVPVKSSRSSADWHDPPLLLLSLDRERLERLSVQPHAPNNPRSFDTIPVAPFGETDGDAASCVLVLEWIAAHRVELVRELRLARVRLAEHPQIADLLADEWPQRDDFPGNLGAFLHPLALRPSAMSPQLAPSSLWNYPTGRALAYRIADIFDCPTFASSLSSIPLIRAVDVAALPPSSPTTARGAGAPPPSGRAGAGAPPPPGQAVAGSSRAKSPGTKRTPSSQAPTASSAPSLKKRRLEEPSSVAEASDSERNSIDNGSESDEDVPPASSRSRTAKPAVAPAPRSIADMENHYQRVGLHMAAALQIRAARDSTSGEEVGDEEDADGGAITFVLEGVKANVMPMDLVRSFAAKGLGEPIFALPCSPHDYTTWYIAYATPEAAKGLRNRLAGSDRPDSIKAFTVSATDETASIDYLGGATVDPAGYGFRHLIIATLEHAAFAPSLAHASSLSSVRSFTWQGYSRLCSALKDLRHLTLPPASDFHASSHPFPRLASIGGDERAMWGYLAMAWARLEEIHGDTTEQEAEQPEDLF